MDWPLVLFLAVVAFFAYRGYQNGLLRSLSRILSLLVAYIASILFTEQVAAILASQFQLQGIVSYITAALGLFIVSGIAVSIIFRLIGEILPATETPSTASSCGGLALGLMVGVIVATIAVWAFAFVRDIRSDSTLEELAQSEQSRIEALANRVAGKAVTTAMSLGAVNPEVARLSAAIIETPAEVSHHAQQLMNSEDLQALLADPQSQAVLDSGDANALRQLPAFQQLVKNPDFLALSNSAGLLTDTTENNALSEVNLATRMTDIWGRIQRVKNDERVQEILGDPEFQQKVQSGNPVDMLTNPRLLELADIVFSNPALPENTDGGVAGAVQREPDPPKPSKKKTQLYSWTDENGQIHISDIKPGS